jgi:hypothetical protein
MDAPIQYLEAAKKIALAAELRNEGYEVGEDERVGDHSFDLVARRGQEIIVIEVKASETLKADSKRVAELRAAALGSGASEFRLVVVNPPREVTVEIEDLEKALYEYLSDRRPPELEILSQNTRVEDVSQVEVSDVSITRQVIRIEGAAIIEVSLEYEPEPGEQPAYADFPFTFDFTLDHNLKIMDGEASVDTASFYE